MDLADPDGFGCPKDGPDIIQAADIIQEGNYLDRAWGEVASPHRVPLIRRIYHPDRRAATWTSINCPLSSHEGKAELTTFVRTFLGMKGDRFCHDVNYFLQASVEQPGLATNKNIWTDDIASICKYYS